MSQKKPRTPYLNPHFAAAMLQSTAALKKTTAIEHSPGKGRAREAALAVFFNERLPHRYKVCEGEVIYLNGCTKPQMDLMFYDRMQNFAFSTDAISVLPAEALLASIEVKSTLSSTELNKSVAAARAFKACGDEHLIDAIYVRNRGLINLTHKIARLEDEDGGAVAAFYFSMLNFIQREGARRRATPYERYTDPPQWRIDQTFSESDTLALPCGKH